MLDLQEIENTISMLENGETTFVNCEKLASLYIVRDRLKSRTQDAVTKEYSDILPSYERYVSTKRRYFLHEVSADAVIQSTHNLCIEISEFLRTLYANTETEEERQEISQLLQNASIYALSGTLENNA